MAKKGEKWGSTSASPSTRRGYTARPWNGGQKANDRARTPTRLHEWMAENSLTLYSLSASLGIGFKTLSYWVNGQSLPPLIWAFKIEKYTRGEVPASAWLANSLAIQWWKGVGSDATK